MDYVKQIRELVGHIPLQLPGSNIVIYRRGAEGIELLMQLRTDHAKFGLLGGGINLGETYKQCAVRELREESGIICDPQDLSLIDVYAGIDFVTTHPNKDVVYHTIVLYSLEFEKVTREEGIDISDETIKLEWMSLNRINSLIKEGAEKKFFHSHIPIIKEIVNGKIKF